MSTGAVIRAAVDDDLAEMLTLYAHLNAADALPPPDLASAAWKQLLAADIVTVFVAALPEGMLVATCTLVTIPNLMRGTRPYGVIENVVTRAEYRRQGYGSAVLHAAQKAAREAGCYKLSLATGSTREATLRFYEAAGFARATKTHFEARWI